jgi:DNA processing protein
LREFFCMQKKSVEQELVLLHALHVAYAEKLGSLHTVLRRAGSVQRAWQQVANSTNLDPASEWRHFQAISRDQNIHLVSRQSAAYPACLYDLAQPPHLLYCRGDGAALNQIRALSIVGSRRPSPYGLAVVDAAVPELVAAGLTIVSGLALGIDGAAAQAALRQSGQTVAVLGSGPDDDAITPRSHVNLARAVCRGGGLLVSEYPPGTPARPYHFPERNRIIAALAPATLVVEAATNSGSLITALAALEIGRSVFAVPGSIFSDKSVGTNRLLHHGAVPWRGCSSLWDELEYLAYDSGSVKPVESSARLSSEEEAILRAVRTADAPGIDQIAQASGLPTSQVTALVIGLHLRGALRSAGPDRYLPGLPAANPKP